MEAIPTDGGQWHWTGLHVVKLRVVLAESPDLCSQEYTVRDLSLKWIDLCWVLKIADNSGAEAIRLQFSQNFMPYCALSYSFVH